MCEKDLIFFFFLTSELLLKSNFEVNFQHVGCNQTKEISLLINKSSLLSNFVI